MLAVARGLCGHKPGIACIMGTGSNSCFYDGEKIASNVSPLGFILGDEGSGAVLGKLLVGDMLKNQMTPELKEKFLNKTGLTPPEIIDRSPIVSWQVFLHSWQKIFRSPPYMH